MIEVLKNKDDKKLKLSVSTSKYINPIMLSSRTAYIAMQTEGFDIKNIQISQINTGIELNKITYKTSDILSKKTTNAEVSFENSRWVSTDDSKSVIEMKNGKKKKLDVLAKRSFVVSTDANSLYLMKH